MRRHPDRRNPSDPNPFVGDFRCVHCDALHKTVSYCAPKGEALHICGKCSKPIVVVYEGGNLVRAYCLGAPTWRPCRHCGAASGARELRDGDGLCVKCEHVLDEARDELQDMMDSQREMEGGY